MVTGNETRKDKQDTANDGPTGADSHSAPQPLPTAAAIAPDSPAADHIRAGASNPVRDAGPDEIPDENGTNWDVVDEGSDESFPASDPPSYSKAKTDR